MTPSSVQPAQHVEGAVAPDPLLEHGEQGGALVVGHALGVSLTDPLTGPVRTAGSWKVHSYLSTIVG